MIRGADRQPLVVVGVGEVWARDPLATYWKKVKIVVTRDGSWTLISPSDQKRLLLLEPSYPQFLGTGKYRRSGTRGSPKKGSNTDSGISGSDIDDSDKEEDNAVHVIGSEEANSEFSKPLHPDMVEVRTDGDSIEVELGANITGSNAV